MPSGLLSSTTSTSTSAHRPHGAQERLDVVTLVVGGQDDDGTHDAATLLALGFSASNVRADHLGVEATA